MARQRDSQASVRSTTQRRAGCFFSPAASSFSSPMRRGFYWGNVGRIAELGAGRFARRVIVAFVEAQMLRLFGGRRRPINHDGVQRQGKQLGVQRQGKQLGVGGVGSADAGREGPAIAFNQDTFLDARLATVTGVGTDALVLTPLFARPLPGTPRAFPRQPSAACQCQSTP